jgi:hypothetical protein
MGWATFWANLLQQILLATLPMYFKNSFVPIKHKCTYIMTTEIMSTVALIPAPQMFSFHLPEKREKKIINDPGTVFTRFSTG